MRYYRLSLACILFMLLTSVRAQATRPWIKWLLAQQAPLISALPPAAAPAQAPTLITAPLPLVGCRYRVQSNDTLSKLAAALNVEVDTLQVFNLPVDVTAPDFFPTHLNQEISIPCPGSTYRTFFPVQEAGCFFYYTLDTSKYPTLFRLALNPPPEFPGPYTIKGIWTANYQFTHLDLLQPGAWSNGTTIVLPTCGHAGTLNVSRGGFEPKSRQGCSFSPIEVVNTFAKDQAPNITVSQVATKLGVDVANLQTLNPDRNLAADTPMQPTLDGGFNQSGLTSISIPCPG